MADLCLFPRPFVASDPPVIYGRAPSSFAPSSHPMSLSSFESNHSPSTFVLHSHQAPSRQEPLYPKPKSLLFLFHRVLFYLCFRACHCLTYILNMPSPFFLTSLFLLSIFFGLSCLGPSGHNQGQLSAAYAYILSDFLPIVLNQLAVELFIELAPRTTMYRYDTHILIRRPRRALYRFSRRCRRRSQFYKYKCFMLESRRGVVDGH